MVSRPSLSSGATFNMPGSKVEIGWSKGCAMISIKARVGSTTMWCLSSNLMTFFACGEAGSMVCDLGATITAGGYHGLVFGATLEATPVNAVLAPGMWSGTVEPQAADP